MKLDFINNILQREPITAATAIGLGITAASQGGQIYAAGKNEPQNKRVERKNVWNTAPGRIKGLECTKPI